MNQALRTLLEQITEDFERVFAERNGSLSAPAAAALAGMGVPMPHSPVMVGALQSAKDAVFRAERHLEAVEAAVRLETNIEILTRHLKGEDVVLAAIQVKGRS